MQAILRPALLAAFLTASAGAHAFCVYNKSDKDIEFQQQGHIKGMTARIAPGKDSCCNWKNKDCNKSKKQTATLSATLIARYSTSFSRYDGDWCGIFVQGEGASLEHQAGGYLVVQNGRHNKSKPASTDNPTYIVTSYSHDHKLLDSYTCPPSYKKLSPGDVLNMILG